MIKKSLLSKISTVLDIVLLLTIAGIFSFSRELRGITVGDIEGDQFTQIFLLSGYSLIFLFTLIIRPIPMRVNNFTILVISYILLVFMSAFWSENLLLTLRRGIALLLTVSFAYILVTKYTSDGLIWLFGLMFSIGIAGSILAIIIFPDYSITAASSEWKGLFTHKNLLGRFCVVSLITFFYLLRTNSIPTIKAAYFILIGLSLLLLIKSQSTTGYILLSVSIGFMLFLKIIPYFKKVRFVPLVFLVAIIGIITMLAIKNIEMVTAWVGRDVTLTGRTLLWQALIPIALNQPFGFGYGAVWVDTINSVSSLVSSSVNWDPTHGHNGYLDVWLQLGWPGLVLILLIVFTTLHNLYFHTIKQDIKKTYWLVIFALVVAYNLVESHLMVQNSIYTILFCLAGFLSSGKASVEVKADGRL